MSALSQGWLTGTTDYAEQQATSESKYGLFISYAAHQPFLETGSASFVRKRALLQRRVCDILQSRDNSIPINTSLQSVKQDPARRSILLDLPPELRYYIYSVLLSVPGVIIVYSAWRDKGDMEHLTRFLYRPVPATASNTPSDKPSQDPIGFPLSTLPHFAATLLRLCRQIYGEARQVLYNSTFRMRQKGSSLMLMTFVTLSAFTPSACVWIRKLEFFVVDGSEDVLRRTFPWFCKEYAHHLDAAFPRLERVAIVMARTSALAVKLRTAMLAAEMEAAAGDGVPGAEAAYYVLDSTFSHPGSSIPRWLDFRIEAEDGDAQVAADMVQPAVAEAWRRLKG